MSTRDLWVQYRSAADQLQALYDAAEGRDLTADEQVTEARINADVDGLMQRIEADLERTQRAASMNDIERRMSQLAAATPEERQVEDSEEARVRAFLRGETRTLTVNGSEQRVQVKGTTTAGGFTIPTSFYDRLVEHMIEVSGIMSAGPTVLRTNSGENLQVPKTTAHGTAAITAENAAISASDSTFGQVTLGAYKYGRLVQVSRELVEDTAVDLLGYLARDCGRSLGNAFGAHAVTGTGSSQPSGVVTGSRGGCHRGVHRRQPDRFVLRSDFAVPVVAVVRLADARRDHRFDAEAEGQLQPVSVAAVDPGRRPGDAARQAGVHRPERGGCRAWSEERDLR